MITFQQLCEFLTCNQRYAWFYLDKSLLYAMTKEELDLVIVKDYEDGFVRMYYPKEKYTYDLMTTLELYAAMSDLMASGNINEAMTIQGKIKERTE